jgi:hypothetical protein
MSELIVVVDLFFPIFLTPPNQKGKFLFSGSVKLTIFFLISGIFLIFWYHKIRGGKKKGKKALQESRIFWILNFFFPFCDVAKNDNHP